MNANAKTLAALDQVVSGRVDDLHRTLTAELDTITVPVRQVPRMRIVSGFTIPDGVEDVPDSEAALRREGFEDRVERLARMKKRRTDLQNEFAAVGITPLAIVPLSVWGMLCKQFGLVRFERLSEEGKTGAPGLDDFAGSILFAAIALLVGLMSGGVTLALVPGMGDALLAGAITFIFMVGVYLLGKSLDNLEEGWKQHVAFVMFVTCIGAALLAPTAVAYSPFILLAGFVPGFLLLGLLVSRPGESLRESLVSLVGKCVLRILPHQKLVRVLFPDGVDGGTTAISVQFPKPPSDVAEVLKKAGDMNLYVSVAADPAAITLNRDEIVRRIQDFAADPVIYVVSGDMVAILAQFGDFPDEKDVVEAAQRIGIPLV